MVRTWSGADNPTDPAAVDVWQLAFDDPLAPTETRWEYDTSFPAFVTEVVQPSVTGNPLHERRTSTIYDVQGSATSRTIAGWESGSPFSLTTTTTYNSVGLLHALHRKLAPTAPEDRISVFYFAGRPVAQLRQVTDGASSWRFLSTDPLGTPALATALAGEVVWHGPFRPPPARAARRSDPGRFWRIAWRIVGMVKVIGRPAPA